MVEGRRATCGVGDDGWELLHRVADSVGLPTQRFLLGVPFRGPEDLKPFRGDGAITNHHPQPGNMLSDFRREEEVLRLLPMLRKVRSIELWNGEALVLHAALPDRLVGDRDAASVQHFFDHTLAQREPEIHPDRIANELGGVAITSVKRVSGCRHPGQISENPGLRQAGGRSI